MSVIGPVIKEQQKILNDCIEKKISLVKLQGVMLKQLGADSGKHGNLGKMELTEEDRALLAKMIEDKDDKDDKSIKYTSE